VVDSTKYGPFLRKVDKTFNDEDLGLQNEEADGQNSTKNLPYIDQIIGVTNSKQGKLPKHCLIKWQDAEFDKSTWELTKHIFELQNDQASSALERFKNDQNTQHLLNHDAVYR